MSILLADIGGTHARLAVAEEGGSPEHIEIFKADDYSNLSDVIQHYLAGLESKPDSFRMATAAWPDEKGVYIFAEDRDWSLDISHIKNLGMDVERVENDFVAAAQGILTMDDRDHTLLRGKKGVFSDEPVAVVGSGTGLGLAYALPDRHGGWRTQQTFGGHMLATAITDEQHDVCREIAKRSSGNVVVFEDMLSGRGLPELYGAVCKLSGLEGTAGSAEEIVGAASEAASKETLRLYHEFLGLFIHTVVLTLHAHGGVYLRGGLFDAMARAKVFDWSMVEKSLLLQNVPSVQHVLRDIPIYSVDKHAIALYGLISINKI